MGCNVVGDGVPYVDLCKLAAKGKELFDRFVLSVPQGPIAGHPI